MAGLAVNAGDIQFSAPTQRYLNGICRIYSGRIVRGGGKLLIQ